MEEQYISMKEASERLGVTRPALYHYVQVLELETKRFKLDRQTYLKMADFEHIKQLRQEVAQRNKEVA